MQITVYSVITTVLWSNLLIVLFSILQRNHWFLDICSVSGMIVLYLFCVTRMCLPVEFSWAAIVNFNQIFNPIQKFFNISVPLIGYDGVEVIHLLISIWIVVSIILLIQLVINYFRLNRKIVNLSCTKDEKLEEVLKCIEREEKKSLKVEVVKSQEIDTPLGFASYEKRY